MLDIQGAAPLPAAPPNLPQTRLTAAEYFKAPVNSEEYDGRVNNLAKECHVSFIVIVTLQQLVDVLMSLRGNNS